MVARSTDCPDGWLAFEGSCYLFGHTPAHFTEAQHFCAQHGGSLIHVDLAMENDFIRTYIRDLHQSDSHHWWLGLTDVLVEGHFKWVDTNTPATFLGWAPGEEFTLNEDCAAFYNSLDFKWADVGCELNDIIPLCEISSV
ncbi:perlucin-like protein [Dreissena polymorpha]|uniref:perlucin-like protein n=1 Tax=Dreissena polymorpha TaxID=45954 RepID=UPI0022643742|nr:perlucin-like protein [Dreissena polymorpha]